jgi:hypothetical protein
VAHLRAGQHWTVVANEPRCVIFAYLAQDEATKEVV